MIELFIRHLFFFGLLGVLSFNALASDGRIELNQASIEADGGFPYTINQRGNYMLTGDLDVPAGTAGLILQASNIVLDLNGFRINGGGVCTHTNCDQGSAYGIRGFSSSFASRTTIRNGTVSGFDGSCVEIEFNSRVEDLLVNNCGRNGIVVNNGSVVMRNVIANIGFEGILFEGEGIYAHNTVVQTGHSGGEQQAVLGGRASAGNYCDDGNCGWIDSRRRFYVTVENFGASQALGACDTGFHMASLYEILEPTQLEYDTTRGFSLDDSGFGPPRRAQGWVRTGEESKTFGDGANCSAWTSELLEHDGTAVFLDAQWKASAVNESPWESVLNTCNTSSNRVWCVEN